MKWHTADIFINPIVAACNIRAGSGAEQLGILWGELLVVAIGNINLNQIGAAANRTGRDSEVEVGTADGGIASAAAASRATEDAALIGLLGEEVEIKIIGQG